MKKFKVTIWLMIEPTKSDKTEKHIFTVNAESETKAYFEAETEINKDIRLKNLSVFNYKVKEEINKK